MNRKPGRVWPGWSVNRLVVLGAVIIGLGSAGCLVLAGALTRSMRSDGAVPTPVFTVVRLPSQTPTLPPATETPVGPTATAAPSLPAGGGQGFAPGDLVEVSGTGGDGLRLRREPSLDAEIVVLGVESEVFSVIAGPTSADGYTWWQLVNPYDSAKKGWAVGSFLRKLGTAP